MAIYDTGTASLAANGRVTGVGTQWTMPLTLIRVGATIIFKTNPLKIYTISEITSNTSIAVYNPKNETVPAGTGYAILAHDGISVQGLAQDVAETLRYYQSKETSIQGLLDFIGQDSFDWPRFEQLANQSVEGAAEALASQVAAAESAATAVSARDTTTAAMDATINAINNAGDAGTLVTLAGWGISPQTSLVLSELDFQTFNFVIGGSYRVFYANLINKPADLIFPDNATLVISVEAGSNNTRGMQITAYTGTSNNFRRYHVSYGTSGSVRNYNVRESIYLPGGNEVGGANAQRVRGLLDVYSKDEVDTAVVSKSNLSDTSNQSLGDAMVGVKQPYSGSVTRTQHSKNSDFLDLLDFGIDITGVNDAGPQLQSLADTLYANNLTMHLRGTVRTSIDLNIRGNVIFEPGFKLIGVKTESGPSTIVSIYSGNIVVSGVILDGVNLRFYPSTSQSVARNKRCISFSNNTLDDSTIAIGADNLSVRNVCVSNNTFKNSGSRNSDAIRLINVSNIDISYNLIQEYRRPIYVTAARSFSNYNINIHHNNMVCEYGVHLDGKSAFRVSKVNISDNDIVCENRNTASGGQDGVLVRYGTSVLISNNNVRTNGRCISCISSKVTIRDNYLVASAVSNFVVGLASCYESAFVSNRVFQNSTAEVIVVHILGDSSSLYRSNNIKVEMNTIKGFGRLIRVLDTVDYEIVNNRLLRTSSNGNAVVIADGTSDRGHVFGNAVVAFSGTVISSLNGSNNVTSSTDSLIVVPSFTKTITEISNGVVDSSLNNSKSFIFSISISDVQMMRALSVTGSSNAKTVSQFMSGVSGATLAWNGSAFLNEFGGAPDIYVNGILQDSYGSEDYVFFRSGMVIDTQNRLSVRDFQCTGDGDTRNDGAGNMTLRNVAAAQAAEGVIHSAFFRSPLVMDGALYNPDSTGIYRKTDFDGVLDPRIAIGQRADGTYIIMCVNGRNADGVSPGCTMQQLANKFISLGCINAFNLDGGGSATLWYNGVVINTPTDGAERPVYHCMYV